MSGSWVEITAGGVTKRHRYDPGAVREMYGFDRAPSEISKWVWGMVERLILEGHNHIEIKWSIGGTSVLDIPAWWFQPLRRLRVELARWKHRGGPDRLLRHLRWCGAPWGLVR